MASTRNAQHARRLARERRAQLDTDRADRDRRIEEATTTAILALEHRTAALRAQHHAEHAAGTALHHLTHEHLRPHDIATLVDLPEAHVKKLMVLAAAAESSAPTSTRATTRRVLEGAAASSPRVGVPSSGL